MIDFFSFCFYDCGMKQEIIRIIISSVLSALLAIAGLFGVSAMTGCATLAPYLIDALIQRDAGVNLETSQITTPEAWTSSE